LAKKIQKKKKKEKKENGPGDCMSWGKERPQTNTRSNEKPGDSREGSQKEDHEQNNQVKKTS